MTRTFAAALLCLVLSAPAAAQDPMDATTVQIMLFGDASYLATERSVPSGFSLGQLVAHANGSLSTRLSVAVETAISSTAGGPVATLERLIVRYDFGDRLRLSGGRFHTPISWWNTQYHHGLWLQTSVDRPQLVRFGTPLVPVHFVGVLAEGTLPTEAVTMSYHVGVGNGRQPSIAGAGDAGDADDRPAVVAALRFRPAALLGLELGAHAYFDEVDDGRGAGVVDERIVGGHAVWTGPVRVAAEYLRIRHAPEAGTTASATDAGYAQLAWPLPMAPAFQPYVRVERVRPPADDPLFSGLGLEYEGLIGGLRWDFNELAALKAEARSESFAGAGRAASFELNASFVVPNLIR